MEEFYHNVDSNISHFIFPKENKILQKKLPFFFLPDVFTDFVTEFADAKWRIAWWFRWSFGMSTHHLDVLPPDHCLRGRISNFLGEENYGAAFFGKAPWYGSTYTLHWKWRNMLSNYILTALPNPNTYEWPHECTSKKAKINIFTLQSEGPSFQTTPFDISFFFLIIDFSLYGKNIKLCFVNYNSHFFKF